VEALALPSNSPRIKVRTRCCVCPCSTAGALDADQQKLAAYPISNAGRWSEEPISSLLRRKVLLAFR
jgi:hypothetical protein